MKQKLLFQSRKRQPTKSPISRYKSPIVDHRPCVWVHVQVSHLGFPRVPFCLKETRTERSVGEAPDRHQLEFFLFLFLWFLLSYTLDFSIFNELYRYCHSNGASLLFCWEQSFILGCLRISMWSSHPTTQMNATQSCHWKPPVKTRDVQLSLTIPRY